MLRLFKPIKIAIGLYFENSFGYDIIKNYENLCYLSFLQHHAALRLWDIHRQAG